MADEPITITPEMQAAIADAKINHQRQHFQGSTNDPVKRPAHYTAGAVEVIDYIEQIVAHYPPEIGYHVGNVLKYLSRAPLKENMLQDMSKAEFYLKRAINKSVAAKPKVNRG